VSQTSPATKSAVNLASPAPVPNVPKKRRRKTASPQKVLHTILKLRASLWRSTDGTPYATIIGDDKVQINVPIRDRQFRHALALIFNGVTRNFPLERDLTPICDFAEAQASYGNQIHEVSLRVAPHCGKIYVDLCNSAWEAVEIDEQGWRVVTKPPVKFRRAGGMLPLPTPTRGGSIAQLRPFLNLSGLDDFILVVAWLCMGFHPTGEYPLLVLEGQQGAAKSTILSLLRSLLDPNTAVRLPNPKSEDDFIATVCSNRILTLDNLSEVPQWLSDALCRLSTGGAFAKRKLYTDNELTTGTYRAPAILTGIASLVERPDLLDRSIVIDLLHVGETRLAAPELAAAFDSDAPSILGAIFDAVSTGLARPIRPSNLPRMAEFARFVSSVESELAMQWNSTKQLTEGDQEYWYGGRFLQAYRNLQRTTSYAAVASNPVAELIEELLKSHGEWKSDATGLLDKLRELNANRNFPLNGLPRTAATLGKELSRIAPDLKVLGIDATLRRETTGRRLRSWSLQKI
jgi:hypothetical protein